MQEVTIGIREKEINSIESIDGEEWRRKIKLKLQHRRMLPVVLYGCETWSLTLREESRLRIFENRI